MNIRTFMRQSAVGVHLLKMALSDNKQSPLLAMLCCVLLATSPSPCAFASIGNVSSSLLGSTVSAQKAVNRKSIRGIDAALILSDTQLPISRRRRGPHIAKVSIVEWSDYECPFCKIFSQEIEKELLIYPADINWTYRFFPLPVHGRVATTEAITGACIAKLAGSAVFWRYTTTLFAMTRGNGHGPSKPLPAILRSTNVSARGLRSCIQGSEGISMVRSDQALAAKAGVLVTPTTFLINARTGKIIKIEGAIKQSVLDSALRTFLDDQRQP